MRIPDYVWVALGLFLRMRMLIIQKDTSQLMKQIALSSVKFFFVVVLFALSLWDIERCGAALFFFFFLNIRDNHLQERQTFFRDLRIPKTDKCMMCGMMLFLVVVWGIVFYGSYAYFAPLIDRFIEAS